MNSIIRILAAAALLSPCHAATLQLTAAMDRNGYITESQFTGGGAAIRFSDTDPDGAHGWYTITPVANAVFSTTDPGGSYITGSRAGTAASIFTNDNAFHWGSLTYDESLLTGIGVETIPIGSAFLDVSGSIDQNLGYNGDPSSVTGLGLIFFDSITPITFGALDAGDTLTFTNGILTGVNLQVAAFFQFDAFGLTPEYQGLFTISGTSLHFAIDDTWTTELMPGYESRVVWDLPGEIAVPEPATTLLGSLSLLLLFQRRRHS